MLSPCARREGAHRVEKFEGLVVMVVEVDGGLGVETSRVAIELERVLARSRNSGPRARRGRTRAECTDDDHRTAELLDLDRAKHVVRRHVLHGDWHGGGATVELDDIGNVDARGAVTSGPCRSCDDAADDGCKSQDNDDCLPGEHDTSLLPRGEEIGFLPLGEGNWLIVELLRVI